MIQLNNTVARIALGTAQFGLPYGIANQNGQVPFFTVKEMLAFARTNNVDTLDTAIAYGESEACLGEVGVKDFKLVTKLPAVPKSYDDVSGWVKNQFTASLSRLGVNEIYGLLLHCPAQLFGVDGKILYQALQSLKETGQVQKIGISIYAPSELEELTQQYHFDLVQAPFNLVDRRLSTTGWLQRLHDEGIEIHTRSAFLQGLLLMAKDGIPAKFSVWSDLWAAWHGWLVRHPITALQACLTYPMSFPEIDRVVVGADSVIQLQQIINAVAHLETFDFPNLFCEDENLINPARWPQL